MINNLKKKLKNNEFPHLNIMHELAFGISHGPMWKSCDIWCLELKKWVTIFLPHSIIFKNMHMRDTFLINTESKSQITDISLRRSNLIECIIDLIFFSIFASDKENVIIFEAWYYAINMWPFHSLSNKTHSRVFVGR